MKLLILSVAVGLWIAVLGVAGELGPTSNSGVDGVRGSVAAVERCR